MLKPRPMQAEVLRFRSGRMGVSAVPGSGKTHTLSWLASELIAEGGLRDDQEVLVVTLVNSAVDNFSARIAGFIKDTGLLPGMGYRVRTLHGLAHDIVRERPDLVGLSDRFAIVDERESDEILTRVAHAWLQAHPNFLDSILLDEFINSRDSRMRQRIMELMTGIPKSFIRLAKDLMLTPAQLFTRLEAAQVSDAVLHMSADIYHEYQRSLNVRSAVDFSDLIRLALQALEMDTDYLRRLQQRWPYILEDEAQDSSRLQELILRKLVGSQGNWVRVGDPNQAIYETFTTANPRYLRDFLTEPGVEARNLANSGRSTHSIIRLANYLVEWTRSSHPIHTLRDALTLPLIEPTPPGDPQPNPQDRPHAIFLETKKRTPEDEVAVVVGSLKRWLPDNPAETVAVLAPRNERAAKIAEGLREAGIDCIELLHSTRSTRRTAQILRDILLYLANPTQPRYLAVVYRHLQENEDEPVPAAAEARQWISSCTRLEEYLAPLPGGDALQTADSASLSPNARARLEEFRTDVQRWLALAVLPVDQLILSLSQEIFATPAELALSHSLALLLERSMRYHPEWTLVECAQELADIATNRRGYRGFDEEEGGFDPDAHPGEVVVATIHKAKGLEWDRVYLLSVNNYDFPSAEKNDRFIAEKYFVRDNLNLEAEVLARLKALADDDPVGLRLPEGEATLQARLDYAGERLRLLYVGITRARKELIVTWNTGMRGDCSPARALHALKTYWENHHETPA